MPYRLFLTTSATIKIGSKLINPFGLLGGCHSRGFRRRLREQYHYPPTGQPVDDAVEAIRINAFLRDFVIDFGPAEVEDPERPEEERGGSREVRTETRYDKHGRNHTTETNDLYVDCLLVYRGLLTHLGTCRPLLPHIKTDCQDPESSYITLDTISFK
jgi:hypothetical protein